MLLLDIHIFYFFSEKEAKRVNEACKRDSVCLTKSFHKLHHTISSRENDTCLVGVAVFHQHPEETPENAK